MTVGEHTVLFVCAHGAGKSRMAAAWFNGSAPLEWRATSAGVTPQAAVSEKAVSLLADTPVAALLDTGVPRSISAVPHASVVVAIDCDPDQVHGATVTWLLDNGRHDEAMRDELRERAEQLAKTLTSGS